MKINKINKLTIALIVMLLPAMAFGAVDDFVVPFKDLLTTWIQGSVGLTFSIVVMLISVIWGAFGGGFGVIGKGFLISILIGGIIFFAEQSFTIGTGFSV